MQLSTEVPFLRGMHWYLALLKYEKSRKAMAIKIEKGLSPIFFPKTLLRKNFTLMGT